jgi:hypothetical protein
LGCIAGAAVIELCDEGDWALALPLFALLRCFRWIVGMWDVIVFARLSYSGLLDTAAVEPFLAGLALDEEVVGVVRKFVDAVSGKVLSPH